MNFEQGLVDIAVVRRNILAGNGAWNAVHKEVAGDRDVMDTQNRYVVFETEWGYAGFLGTERGVRRSILPNKKAKKVQQDLLVFCRDALCDNDYMPALRERVITYFEGKRVDFSVVRLELGILSAFSIRILDACRRIPFGGTLSYSQLAAAAGSLQASRAAGSVMAKNPLPLIIPCHRVICSDGRVGEFSAGGGAAFKSRLLEFEAGHSLSRQVHPPRTSAPTNAVTVWELTSNNKGTI